jgi:hypothetical protein
MHVVRKFPNLDKDEWAEGNSKKLVAELQKYQGLFKDEPTNSAFQDLMVEHLYLQEQMEEINGWKDHFLRFLANSIDEAENEMNRKGSNAQLQMGKLSLMRDISAWF